MIAELILRSGLDARQQRGEPATSIEYRVDAERTVRLLADVLARLHAVELGPVERSGARRPDDIVRDLDRAVTPGVDAPRERATAADDPAEVAPPSTRSRSAAYAHISDGRLLEILRDGAETARERGDDPVLTHGAPTLANLRCDRGTAVGLVEWSRVAVADRYRDLAVAARSVATDLAPILVPVLFEHYGADTPDGVRLDWYALAAELSTAGVTDHR